MADLAPTAVTLDTADQVLVVQVEGGDTVHLPLALAVQAAEQQGLGPADLADAEAA
jgi:hypothetical protein